MNTTFKVATLLEQAAWMRELATYLLRDGQATDDAIQDTWVAVLAAPPDQRRPLRPWLAEVLRNTVRSSFRRHARRQAREREVARLEAPAPSTEDVLARTQLHQRLAELVARLDEPYRTTVLMRFYDGLDSPEISRRTGVSAGTVRWRISEAVRRLREGLDESYRARRDWRPVLAIMAGGDRSGGSALSLTSPAAAVVFSVGLGLAGLGLWLAIGPISESPSPGQASTAAARPVPSATMLQQRPSKETNLMSDKSLTGVALLAGVALPALAAGAHTTTSGPLMDDALQWCVEMRERVFACKQESAEAMIASLNPPVELRPTLLRKALEEITADGSGQLERRRESCRPIIERKRREYRELGDGDARGMLDGMKKVLAFCSAKPDCKARVECMMPFLSAGAGAPQPTFEPKSAPGSILRREGRLSGRVVDMESGSPLANVEVRATAVSERPVLPNDVSKTFTDAAGKFVLDGVAVGVPVKLKFSGNLQTHTVEWRYVSLPQQAPVLEMGPITVMRGDLQARLADGSWKGLTGVCTPAAACPAISIRVDDVTTIKAVRPGTPAARAGIKAGDRLLAIDGKDLTGMRDSGVEWLLRGQPGSAITVTVQTSGQPARNVTLNRSGGG